MSQTLECAFNNTHEGALTLTFKDNQSSFKQFLEKNHSMTVHHKNVQVLVTQIFKVKNILATNIMTDVSELKEPTYILQSESNHFTCRNGKITYYGLLPVNHLAPQIWELVPQSVGKCKTLNECKTKIKSWYPDHCPCRLGKTCKVQLGFIWSTCIFLWQNQVMYYWP